MITFFSAWLRSRCGPLADAGTGDDADALSSEGVLLLDAALLLADALLLVDVPAVPGKCGVGSPPAQADSASPAANSAASLSLPACKRFPFLA
jgi:hypothetical protein